MDSAFEILTAAYNLEEPLRCLKLGINGLWDFHSHFNKTYQDMAEIIGDSDEASLLRRNIGKYFFKVLGRQECGMDTAALTTMIHASRTRGDLKMITQQVAMYGADKDNSTMNALAVQAATTGTFQCDVAKTGCMRNDSEGLGVSLMRLFTEIACFDVDRQRSFEKLRKEFGNLDLSRCKTFSMAIATEMLSYDMCEGSYGGPFCTTYVAEQG
jgi:hypothetical protein